MVGYSHARALSAQTALFLEALFRAGNVGQIMVVAASQGEELDLSGSCGPPDKQKDGTPPCSPEHRQVHLEHPCPAHMVQDL